MSVFIGMNHVGTLAETERGLSFTYSQAWLNNPDASPVSKGMPLTDAEVSDGHVESFFGNLLPEGEVLAILCRILKITPGNTFALLEKLGGDMAGNCTTLPEGEQPAQGKYIEISSEHLHELLRASKDRPLAATSGIRFSLAGAQEKISIKIDSDGRFYLPYGVAASTHIVKPKILGRDAIMHSAVNEAFIMSLARAIGIGAASVQYRADLEAVIVERYDREITNDGSVRRLAQEDFCQLLNIQSNRKYEEEGGPELKDCFAVMKKQSSQPALDAKRLVQWVIFNVLAGNMDGHAKNIAMADIRGSWQLAPFYDLLCTTAYEHYNDRLAFRIGGQDNPKQLRSKHWQQFAGDLGLSDHFVKKQIAELSAKTEHVLPSAVDSLLPLLDASEKAFVDRLTNIVLANIRLLKIRLHEDK